VADDLAVSDPPTGVELAALRDLAPVAGARAAE
jgi:hypothetical protein